VAVHIARLGAPSVCLMFQVFDDSSGSAAVSWFTVNRNLAGFW
jgi:hypothetical protein